jgi:DNA polymerase III alpha subunit
MPTKSKTSMLQTKLTFTKDGRLECEIPLDDKPSKKSRPIVKQLEVATKGYALRNTVRDKLPTPLPKDYQPPNDLNQYELLDLNAEYDIGDKLNYYPVMLEKVRAQYRTKGTRFPEKHYNQFYSIFDDKQSRILISLFKRDIPQHTKYFKRLAEELHLIKERNFTKVFLQVMDILVIASELGIPHIIRGSAGSSLVCYLLRITDIDPIMEDISLARFMHTRRKDLPDIDIDFPNNTRHLIYERIFRQYGKRVARISNHVAYSMKTAIKDAMRSRGYRQFLPKDFEIVDYVDDASEVAEIEEEAESLDGTFKQYSLHCGGIIIFDKPIPTEYILQIRQFEDGDIEYSGKRPLTWQQSLLNKDQVDDYQFIKIDILSNRGLAQLWDICKDPIESYFKGELDPAVLNMLAAGGNIGIVYAESRAMFKALVNLQPSSLGDIALALAIIRPVARELKGAYFKEYHEYQLIKEDLATSRTLKERLGNYIIYDDDAIQYIQRLIGCNAADADIYRKVFSKCKWNEMRDFAFMLAAKRPDLTVEQRQLIYDQLCNLSAYSFCKSHAISYAKLVYALAYHKYHQPQKFWVSALNNCNSSYRRWTYYREAVAVGFKLTLGYKPWQCDGTTLVSTSTRRIPDELLSPEFRNPNDEKTKIKQYFTMGYWTSSQFLDGCYYNTSQVEGSAVVFAKFCGLIANYRICKMRKKTSKKDSADLDPIKKERNVTFATLGYDNGRYIDVVLYGKIGLGKCHIIEGHGILNDATTAPWVQVKKWKCKWLDYK